MPSFSRASEPALWAVVRTHRHKETLALRELERQNYTAICPMIEKTIRRARRLQERKVALFPGYIFIGLNAGQHWRPVNSTLGVSYMLTDEDGRPGRLPAGFVEDLRARTDEHGVFRSQASLSEGDVVRVRSGAFSDFLGRVESLDDQGRASVLLELMSRTVRVSLPAQRLQAMA